MSIKEYPVTIETPVKQPQVGDVVHYYCRGEGPLAALVAGFMKNGKANLAVFSKFGHILEHPAIAVPYETPEPLWVGADTMGPYWVWPPEH